MERYALFIQSNNDINAFPGSSDRRVREAYLEEIVAASDAGFIVLVGKYMISGSRKYFRESISNGLDALSGFPADFYGIVQETSAM